MVTISWKDLGNKIENENINKYHLQGQSAKVYALVWSWSWVVRKMFSIIEPDLYTKLLKKNTEGKETETYKIFVLPMGNTKITE